jgi:hypothetical protein
MAARNILMFLLHNFQLTEPVYISAVLRIGNMSTQYRLVQSGKTASGGCSAGPSFVRACSATDLLISAWRMK